MGDIRTLPIEPERFYHIYNRGVNGNTIFRTEANYQFFLDKVFKHLTEVCDIYAFSLLPNHFHFLVKIKNEKELQGLVKVSNLDKAEKGLHSPQNIFSKQFARIFNSYAQAFNKMYNRHGALIESPFKSKHIDSDEYLIRTILYIHQNETEHDHFDY